MCVLWHTYIMARSSETPVTVARWFREEATRLWPAALGSLSLRRSPCIRPGCPVCQTGEQHASYVLYGREGGKRFAVYIPDELAPQIREALENGRKLRAVLYEAGRRYAEALKHERDRTG